MCTGPCNANPWTGSRSSCGTIPRPGGDWAKLLEIPPEYVSVAMGDDIRQAWVSNNHPMEGIVHDRDGQSHVDDWGVEWTRIDGFNQISKYPLGERHR